MKKSRELGCLAVGAHADLIVIDRNLLNDIHVMTQPEQNFSVIMKGGEFIRQRL